MNNTPAIPPTAAEWIRLNVLPPLWRHPDGIDELRICLCQAPPSDWLGGTIAPAARLWNRDGRTVAWGPVGEETKFQAGLVEMWETDRVCQRRRPPAA
ncbi:hypothetical protein QA860_08140 [Streptomyces stelliscabiei]|uniref:hypothetical protein n=1 Tax=Streptomyces stelliscabiei TaxID=146820 RepID=UPI002FF05BB3